MIGRRFYLGAAVALAVALTALESARADFTFTQGSGTTAFSFTTTTGGTALCAAASTHCFASVPINAAGAGLFITGNAGLVTGTGGTFPATQSGAWNITNISGTISLPTGAATATGLSTINTTLGSPFQVGGSIANTTFASTQSGTWTMQPGNTANTTPWLQTINQGGNSAAVQTAGGDGQSNTASGLLTYSRIGCWNGTTWDRCTQVSAGVAGTPSTQVLTIQGIASMTPILVTGQASTADIGNVGGRTNVTPSDCSGTIATGGTAQNAVSTSSTRRGVTIANIDTAEPMWISFTGTAVAGAVASYPLAPAAATTFAELSSYTTPLGFGFNTALSVIAATSTHKFSCTAW